MKRREFTQLAGLSAVAVWSPGFIQFNGQRFEADCQTTSDILGPFYRPDSPVRNNLVVEGTSGDIVQLSGTIRHKDCQTPFENAKIELWHCSADEVYDNDSDEYLYRGTAYSNSEGHYQFTTQMPVPYGVGGGVIRPAHFHLMISAPGLLSLITQIYFQGDPYLTRDTSSADPKAERRILAVKEAGETKHVSFDCNMSDRLLVSYDALSKIVGKYQNNQSGEMREFFSQDNQLWLKNEVYGEKYDYVGANQFEYSGMPTGAYRRLHFKLEQDGAVNLQWISGRQSGSEETKEFTKLTNNAG